MSEKADKDDEHLAGIGHNQGPAIDQEPLPESDKLNLVTEAKAVSGGATDHFVGSDDYSANSSANLEDQSGSRSVAGYEAKWAAGYTKVGGKYIAADGLVSRGGFRRIIPEETDWDREKWAERAAELADAAGKILHGRNATIFEGRVLDPLRGRPKRSVDDLAAQFGIAPKRVYKIVERCSDRVMAALSAPSQRMDHKGFVAARDELYARAYSEKCLLCGRCFALTALSACRGVFGVSGNKAGNAIRSECLRIQYRTKEFQDRLSKLQAEHHEWYEQEGRFQAHARRWKAEYEATQAELAAHRARWKPLYERAELARKTEYEVWKNQMAVLGLWDFRVKK
jgi:hypothetical protein